MGGLLGDVYVCWITTVGQVILAQKSRQLQENPQNPPIFFGRQFFCPTGILLSGGVILAQNMAPREVCVCVCVFC